MQRSSHSAPLSPNHVMEMCRAYITSFIDQLRCLVVTRVHMRSAQVAAYVAQVCKIQCVEHLQPHLTRVLQVAATASKSHKGFREPWLANVEVPWSLNCSEQSRSKQLLLAAAGLAWVQADAVSARVSTWILGHRCACGRTARRSCEWVAVTEAARG